MTQVGHRFCKDVCITLTAIWLLSTSGCRQGTDVSSSTPPQADSPLPCLLRRFQSCRKTRCSSPAPVRGIS